MQPNAAKHQYLADLDLKSRIEGGILQFFNTAANVLLQPVTPCGRPSATPDCITAMISFSGSERGFLALSCSVSLARRLTALLMSEQEESADQYLGEVLGDTAGILANSLLEETVDRHRYRLSLPIVTRSNTELLNRLLSDQRGATCCFSDGETRLMVKVVVTPANCIATTASHLNHPGAAAHHIRALLTCGRCGDSCCLHPGSHTRQPLSFSVSNCSHAA